MLCSFSVSGLYLCTSQLKPFNPILGETLQGSFSDGTKLYAEHISHHPPITNFHIQPEDEKYDFFGSYEFFATMGANYLRAGQKGANQIKFADGQHVRFTSADYKLGGTVYGDRTIEPIGNIYIEDLTNNYKCFLILNTHEKHGLWWQTETGAKDEFVGLIY